MTDKPVALPLEKIPQHVAIIMDGNGRWALSRGLPRLAGHGRAGLAVLAIVLCAVCASAMLFLVWQ